MWWCPANPLVRLLCCKALLVGVMAVALYLVCTGRAAAVFSARLCRDGSLQRWRCRAAPPAATGCRGAAEPGCCFCQVTRLALDRIHVTSQMCAVLVRGGCCRCDSSWGGWRLRFSACCLLAWRAWGAIIFSSSLSPRIYRDGSFSRGQ